jgi:hypothetical protein
MKRDVAIPHFFVVISLYISYIVQQIINKHMANGYIHPE